MLTHNELESLRKANVLYVRQVGRAFTRAQANKGSSPRQYRSAELTVLRLAHVYHNVAHVFNRVSERARKNGYMRQLNTYSDVLNNKYVPTALSLLQVLHSPRVPLDRWILSQAERLNLNYFNLYHCYGYNAHARYDKWEGKQKQKYVLSSEQKAQTESKDRGIARSITESHQTALKWRETLKQIEAPSTSLALWYLWPTVSVWYVLAHDEFREDILESGLCNTPMLVKRWRSYERSPHVQQVCVDALQAAESTYGKLSW